MKTREQKLLEQNHELEKIADQLEQQTLQKQYNSASWLQRWLIQWKNYWEISLSI